MNFIIDQAEDENDQRLDKEERTRNMPQENDEQGYSKNLSSQEKSTLQQNCRPKSPHQINREMTEPVNIDNQQPVEQNDPLMIHQGMDEERINREEPFNPQHVDTQSIIEIMLSFYQISYALRMRTAFRTKHMISMLIDIMTIPATLIIDLPTKMTSLCLTYTNDAISIEFLRTGPLLWCLFIVATLIVAMKISKFIRRRCFMPAVGNAEDEPLIQQHYHRLDHINEQEDGDAAPWMPIEIRFQIVYLQFLMVAYLPLSMFLLKLCNCVSLDGEDQSVMFMQGSVACISRSSQLMALLILIFCMAPQPLVLLVTSRLLKSFQITPNQFILSLTFPPLLLLFWLKNKRMVRFTRKQETTAYHLLQYVEGRYRHYGNNQEMPQIPWKSVRMLFRFVISIISVIIGHNLYGLLFASLVLVAFAIIESRVNPFKSSFVNRLSSLSWMVLCSITVIMNLYWLFTGVFNVEENPEVDALVTLGQILLYIECVLMLSPVFFLIIRIVIFFFYMIFFRFLRRKVD